VLGAPPRTAQSSQTPKLYIANVKCDKCFSRNRLIPMITDERLGTRVHGARAICPAAYLPDAEFEMEGWTTEFRQKRSSTLSSEVLNESSVRTVATSKIFNGLP
jgi:hypothetical protein